MSESFSNTSNKQQLIRGAETHHSELLRIFFNSG